MVSFKGRFVLFGGFILEVIVLNNSVFENYINIIYLYWVIIILGVL